MSDTTHSSRISAFKNTGKGSQELRRKRAETSVALRRAARDEQLLKRRACSPDEDNRIENDALPTPEEIVQGLHSGSPAELLTAARAARRTLSRQLDPPISEMIRAGVVAPLVAALDNESNDVQFEAAWALTNIASGNHNQTLAVIDGGAVPKLVSLLSGSAVLAEQCAWALGNIAGDGAQARDLVLSHAVLPALLPMLEPAVERPATLVRTAVWTVSNLCRNKNPLVDLKAVSPVLPYLSHLLTSSDKEVLSDTCWSLSYLTDGPNDRIEAVQTAPELLPRVVAALSHEAVCVQTPALRAVGNMVTGSDVQTDRCLDAGCLPRLIALLQGHKSSLVKEAAWCASNILAGSQPQIQRAIDAGVLPPLVRVLTEGEIKCQKEAAWAVTNLCLGGTGPQLCALLSSGMLQPYCALLGSPDPRAVTVVLEGVSHLLQAAEKFGEVEELCIRLEEQGTLDKLEALQHHENEQIYKKTLHILDTYFADNAEEKNAPEQTEEEYQFGTVANGANGNHIGDF